MNRPSPGNSHRKIISVFVASPGDVAEERQRLAKVVESLNERLAEHLGVQLQLKEWRQVAPGMGRPEDVILDQLPVGTWDVFIGLLWLRFGMPPGKNRAGENHDSGTEEEFRLAYRAWQERRRPRILFYRCTRPAPVFVDARQLAKVQRFFKEFGPRGKNPGLFQDFGEADDFEKTVEKHLTGLLIEESQVSALQPRMRAVGARSSRGYEAQTPEDENLLTSATTTRGKGDDGWRNPFIVGVPIADPADFFGREREINFCLQRLRGMQSVALVGQKATGKTSMLLVLLELVRREDTLARTAYIDVNRSMSRTLVDTLDHIRGQLGLADNIRTLADLDVQLHKMRSIGLRPILAVDNLQAFGVLRPGFAVDFCETLRPIASAGDMALILASDRPLRLLYDQGLLTSPLFNIMGTRELGALTNEEAQHLFEVHRTAAGFTSEQFQAIIRRANAHPLRLQVFCFHVAQANHERREDWDAVWAEAETEARTLLDALSVKPSSQ